MGLIQFTMNRGEKIIAEAAAMVYIRGNIETETRMRKGGFLKSLKAAALGGESFFVNEFIAQEDNCHPSQKIISNYENLKFRGCNTMKLQIPIFNRNN